MRVRSISGFVLSVLIVLSPSLGCKRTAGVNGDEVPVRTQYVFAKGVNAEKGWLDIDKRRTPDDIMSCWLITASNMLQWWQDRYKEAGGMLPEGTPDGAGDGIYGAEIFDDAVTRFVDLRHGGDISNGLSWYITGEYQRVEGHAWPKPGTGGYLKDIAGMNYTTAPFLKDELWNPIAETAVALELFSKGILGKLSAGDVVGMDIKTHLGLGGGLHAITVWGVELEDNGVVKALYMTDSDDFERRLVRCPVFACDDDYFKTKEIGMKLPVSNAYPEGGEWAILRLYSLSAPETVK